MPHRGASREEGGARGSSLGSSSGPCSGGSGTCRAQPHPVCGEPAGQRNRYDGWHAVPAVHRLQGGAPVGLCWEHTVPCIHVLCFTTGVLCVVETPHACRRCASFHIHSTPFVPRSPLPTHRCAWCPTAQASPLWSTTMPGRRAWRCRACRASSSPPTSERRGRGLGGPRGRADGSVTWRDVGQAREHAQDCPPPCTPAAEVGAVAQHERWPNCRLPCPFAAGP